MKQPTSYSLEMNDIQNIKPEIVSDEFRPNYGTVDYTELSKFECSEISN